MTDTFKKVYTAMPEDIQKTIFKMKSKAEELQAWFDTIDSEAMRHARIQLKDAVMWSTRAWVEYGDECNQAKEESK